MAWRKPGLSGQIFIGMIFGVIVGWLLNISGDVAFLKDFVIDGVFSVVGKIFVVSLKMLVVPLVFVSLVCGTSTLGDPKKLGRVGGKTLSLYLMTTAIAITIALFFASVINPGEGITLDVTSTYAAKEAPSLKEVLINIFPSNPIKAMAEGNMLQVIVFSVLFGVALALVGRKGEPLANFFNTTNDVIMKMVSILMNIAPYGVFCLLAKVIAEEGFGTIANLLVYFWTVVFCLILHGVLTYGGILTVVGRLNPIVFVKKMRPVLLMAFGTSSSNATLPATVRVAEKGLGVDNSAASFTLPLGATINMDGTAIMQGVATVFIAQASGIELGMSEFLQVIATATLASVGTAGVPGVGLITLTMVLQQVGLPVEGIAMIIGVDRLLDMTRTAVNVSGDAAVTCVVAQSEGQFNKDIYLNPECTGSEEADVS